MTYDDTEEIAAAHALTAFEAMRRHGVPAHPDNFTVWYAFVSGRIPELGAIIEGLLKRGQTFDSGTNAHLHECFFGTARAETRLREIGTRVESTVARLVDFLTTANQDAAHYGFALESFSGTLADRAEPNAFSELVRTVLDDTRSMIAANHELEARLHSSSGEIVRLREDLDQLRREASTDPLTALANRKTFDLGLHEAALEAEERGTPLSLLMVDIDFFKRFNDTHGHQLGDQVLKLVARTMSDCVGDRDIAARYGGEEFSVILPGSGLTSALAIGEAIRAAVAGKNITNRRTGKALGQITLSVGCAEFVIGEPVGNFLHRADEALYLAKRSGRNQVVSEAAISTSNQIALEPAPDPVEAKCQKNSD